MRIGSTTRVLLALAFVVGQWFAVVHGAQHELNSSHKLAACHICAVHHASAVPPAAATLTILRLRNVEPPAVAATAAPQRKPHYRPPTRGPPEILA